MTNSPAAAANQATNSAPFTDISNDPNRIFITYLYQLGIVGGFPDGKYSPQLGLSRAQAAVVICKAAKLTISQAPKNTFRDVAPNHWAAPYVYTASAAGLLKGFPDGTFRPEATLTRAQGISLIMRLCTQKERASLPPLQDMTSQHWAAPDMATALSLDMISTSPDGKQINPDAEMTRSVLARSLAILLTKDPGLNHTELAGGLKEITGDVTLTRNNKTEPITNDIVVYEGDIIKTGLNSRARIVYRDGSGTLIEANSEIVIKKADGKSYIKQDGTAGVAVDYLNIELKSGTLFGALSTKNENNNNDKQASRSAIFTSKQALKQLAAAETAQPWYKTAEQKKVKVKVDMPWGVAAIRGTFIKVSVNPNGTCDVACLTGSAEVSGSNGAPAPLGGGQSSSISTQGSAPTNAAPMSQEDKAAFAQEQAWVVNTALLVDTNKAAEVLVETKENQTVEQKTETTVKTVIDALKASGIEIKTEVINKLKEDIQKTLNDEKTVQSLTKDVETSTTNNSNTNTNTSTSGSSGSSDATAYIAYNTAGTYGGESSSAVQTLSGSAIINVAGVTLHNLIITGTLTLASGIGEGNITLQNVTVRDNTVINGGGPNSIELIDSTLYTVTIDKANNSIRIIAKGNTNIGALTLNSGATLQEDGLSGTGTGFSRVLTGLNIPAGAMIILSGNFDSLTLNAPGCAITLANGTGIQSLTANVATTIGGAGRIVNAVINAGGVTLAQAPANISLGNGITASIAGQSFDASIFSGTTGCIAGRVVDSGGQGIAGAGVIAHIGTASPIISPATTVSNGSFILTGLSPAIYNLEIIPPIPGTAVTPVFYIPFSLSGVNVTAGKITTVSPDIVMSSTTVIPLTAVAISGDPVVGSTLTALPTPANATATYSWKVDGAPAGTGPTYLVTAGDVGKTITVTATGTGSFSGTVNSGALSITTIPLTDVAVFGNPAVGSTLTAMPTPADATADYSWKVDDTQVGTGPTYLVTVGDVSKTITVTATGTGSFSGTVNSSGVLITAIPLIDVAISGSPAVGSTLTAILTPANATADYSWKVDDTQVGTGPTYLVTAADVGKTITVTATGTGAYTGTVTGTASSTAVIPLTAVTMTGNAVVGAVLTATLTPVDATADFSWKADATEVGTGSTYLVTPADVDKTITVTANGTGNYGGTLTSAATSLIPPEPLTDWSSIQTLPGDINGLAVGSNQVLAVGNCKAYISADGIAWTPISNGLEEVVLYSVAYGNGRYVAVGDGVICTLDDNQTSWNVIDVNISDELSSVAYDSGHGFVALGGNTAWVSANGLENWISNSIGVSGNGYLSSLAYGNGVFVAVGWDSPSDWTQQYPVSFTSTNGTTWAKNAMTSANSGQEPMLTDVAFVDGKFMALESVNSSGSDFPRYAYTSSDGVIWSQSLTTPASQESLYSSTGDGSTIIVNSDNALYKSPDDGVTWLILPTLSKNISDMVYFKGGFIGVGGEGGLRCGPGGGGSGTNTTILTASDHTYGCDTHILKLVIDPSSNIVDSTFDIKKITISHDNSSYTLNDDYYCGTSSGSLIEGQYCFDPGNKTLSIKLTESDYDQLVTTVTSLYTGVNLGNITVSAAAGWNNHFGLGDAAASNPILITVNGWTPDEVPPSAITIDTQDSIPSGGYRMLTVAGGPLSTESWNSIFTTIKSHTGANGDWIYGIIPTDLSLVIEPGNVSARLTNSSATNAAIGSNFTVPKSDIIDLAGNAATDDLVIESWSGYNGIQFNIERKANGFAGYKQKDYMCLGFASRFWVEGTANGSGPLSVNMTSDDGVDENVETQSVTSGDAPAVIAQYICNALNNNTNVTSNYGTIITGVEPSGSLDHPGCAYIQFDHLFAAHTLTLTASGTGIIDNVTVTAAQKPTKLTITVSDGVMNGGSPVQVLISTSAADYASYNTLAELVTQKLGADPTIAVDYDVTYDGNNDNYIYLVAKTAREERTVSITFASDKSSGISMYCSGNFSGGMAGTRQEDYLTVTHGPEVSGKALFTFTDGVLGQGYGVSRLIPFTPSQTTTDVATAIYNAFKDCLLGYTVTNPEAGNKVVFKMNQAELNRDIAIDQTSIDIGGLDAPQFIGEPGKAYLSGYIQDTDMAVRVPINYTDYPCSVFYVVVASGGSAPTAEQILAGLDANNSAALFAGSVPAVQSDGCSATFGIHGAGVLQQANQYSIYMVTFDSASGSASGNSDVKVYTDSPGGFN